MKFRNLEFLIIVIFNTCILYHYCLDADEELSESKLKGDLNGGERVKRVVSWDTWKKEQQKQTTQEAQYYISTTPRYYPGHIDNYEIKTPEPPKNSKWKVSKGQNQFLGQGNNQKEEDEWYEGVSSESKKPRKEKLQPHPSDDESSRIAIFDPVLGVKCPKTDSTGFFVYPLDCRFYVNCWNGRAFVEPCAPGTLFSPDDLECDFPNKVKCYDNDDEDVSGIRTRIDESHIGYDDQDSLNCPPSYNGFMAHPKNCSKYLQCINGNTYIIDCNYGTVFNSFTGVCDWPKNVKGCEDYIVPVEKSEEEIEEKSYLIPAKSANDQEHSDLESFYAEVKPTETVLRSARRIDCPPGFSGLLPFPDTCKKFLQCASGRSFTMDCGPGTVFNPYTMVCDWPYNVPGCNNEDQPNDYGLDVRLESRMAAPGNGYSASTNIPRTYKPQVNENVHSQIPIKEGSKQYPQTRYSDTETQESSYQPQIQNSRSGSVKNSTYQNKPYSNNKNVQTDFQPSQTQKPYQPPTNFRPGIVQPTQNPNLQQNNKSAQKKHDINGHGYPYNYNPDNPSNLNRDTSSEEVISSQGRAWAEPPAKTQNVEPLQPTYNDRRNYSRGNEKWSQPDIQNPTPSNTWRGMGRGFETRPTYPTILQPVTQEEEPFPIHYEPPVAAALTRSSYKPSQMTPHSGQMVRLRGGENPSEGYVEVQGAKPGWGTVCDTKDGWTQEEANVVCRQLGFRRGAAYVWQGRPNSPSRPNWIAANSVSCNGTETKFQSCKFTHKPYCQVERDAIAVRCLPNRAAHCRIDELAHDGTCYHIADSNGALSHSEAHEYCHNRGSRLIDVVDQLENDFLSEVLIQNMPDVDSVMTAGMGFATFNRTIWMWEDATAARFKFTKWWPGWLADKKVPPFAGNRPICVIMTRKFPCHNNPDSNCKTDYFFWDVEDCASSNKGHSFICERPYDDIGCVYGNGHQYVGNASITVSGRPCLSWGDMQVSRPLLNKVPNKEIRDKLKDHNYCRNPNPSKEARPWCFTGPRGEYDYCDIPYCGKMISKKSHLTGKCKPKHFECLPGECIPSPWVCDGEEDCTNGADERKCSSHINFFKKYPKHKLDGYEVEKWLNTPAKTCALRCKEADFTCRSFTHQAQGNVCYLSDSNIGMTGALEPSNDHDYYELKDHMIDCEDMFVCANQKCINRTLVCDGKNDCLDRSDEKICTAENLGYDIRLAGANSTHEGRIEVKVLGKWGQVCDDSFDMIDADVICKELGFDLGALEVRPGGFYGNMDPPDAFMVDQLKCRGNETTLRECDFEGWGKHNCQPDEAAGIVCKTRVDTCQEGHWKCDTSAMCIPTPFICDEVRDCPDGSDESPEHCDAPFEIRLANGSNPMEGRVEIRHHGIWGTVCDDDFNNATATVICRSLGYGGPAIFKKDGFFGPGTGPIWLDEVFCHGNETQLYRCEHDHWGRHNCDHNEDAGVVCSSGEVPPEYEYSRPLDVSTRRPDININDLLPSECGKRVEDFDEDDELIFERVVRSSIAPRGSYPWQASIRVRGHSKSSHWCGAVVLSPLHVLTAAHCLEGYNKGTYFVRAGDYDTEVDEGTEEEANIEDYYIHEDFRKGHRMNNDIAVVLLKGRGIPLGRHVMPICLPHENIEYPTNLNCTISGFGSIEAGSSRHSRKLRFGWVPLLDQNICKADYVYGQAVTDGMICAGHLEGGPDTCDGDSGGPLACPFNGAFTLYGLTSWGQHCGRANKPGVYVRIAHYRKWIDEKIKESLIGR